MPNHRSCDHDKVIEAKRKNPYLTSTGAVKDLNLSCSTRTVRAIWEQAKARGEL